MKEWEDYLMTGSWKGASDMQTLDLQAPIVQTARLDQRIVTAAVMVPGEADSDGEIVSKEKVMETCENFLRYGILDAGHTLNPVAVPVESWILRRAEKFGEINLPEGSWMMSVKVQNDKAWEEVKQGKLKGFSILALRKADYLHAVKEQAFASQESFDDFCTKARGKRILLKDLGKEDDWFVLSVSMVKEPAVFKSKWVAIKSANDDNSLAARILALLHKEISLKPKPKNEEEKEMDDQQVKTLIAETVKAELAAALPILKKELTPEKPPEAAKPETELDSLKKQVADLAKYRDEKLVAEAKVAEEAKAKADASAAAAPAPAAPSAAEAVVAAGKSRATLGQEGPAAAPAEKNKFPRDVFGRRVKD
jgi:hypothetical protein